MNAELTWQNPPARKKQTYTSRPETQAIIDALKSRPGEWALIKKDVSVNTTTWWKKRPGIEAKSSTMGKPQGKCDVYARYVGIAA
jgi:hypothetical protein